MPTGTHESDFLAQAVAATDAITPPHPSADGREEPHPPERDRSADLDLEIRTIASRILAAALIDGALGPESVAG